MHSFSNQQSYNKRVPFLQLQRDTIRTQRTHDGGSEGEIRWILPAFGERPKNDPPHPGERGPVGGNRRPDNTLLFLTANGNRCQRSTYDVRCHVWTRRISGGRFHVREEITCCWGSRCACALLGNAWLSYNACGLRETGDWECSQISCLESMKETFRWDLFSGWNCCVVSLSLILALIAQCIDSRCVCWYNLQLHATTMQEKQIGCKATVSYV